jgi:hypothetical protein
MLYIDKCKHCILKTPVKNQELNLKKEKKVARSRARTSDPRNPEVKTH